MEDDRAQVDLGIAADIEAAQLPESSAALAQTTTSLPLRQPKKRFVGRRAADAAKSSQGAGGAVSTSTDVQSMLILSVSSNT